MVTRPDNSSRVVAQSFSRGSGRSLVRMHPADAATTANATSKFARRTNAGFADATCNVTTA